MIGQRHRNAVLQRGAWEGLIGGEGNLTIADERERVTIMSAPGVDQAGLTMNEQADSIARFAPAEPDRGAAFWPMGKIGGLAPFQRLFERARARCRGSCFKHQRSKLIQIRTGRFGARREHVCDAIMGLWFSGTYRQGSAPFLRRFANVASRIRF